jgi:hypothetical protein
MCAGARKFVDMLVQGQGHASSAVAASTFGIETFSELAPPGIASRCVLA